MGIYKAFEKIFLSSSKFFWKNWRGKAKKVEGFSHEDVMDVPNAVAYGVRGKLDEAKSVLNHNDHIKFDATKSSINKKI